MKGHSLAAGAGRGPRSSAPRSKRFARGRRPILSWDELDSDPRHLRQNLDELDLLLRGSNPRVRRRILLMFGELVARWQDRFLGEPISVTIEFLPDAERMTFRNSRATLTPTDWEELVSPVVLDLVDAWGMDRRRAGNAWFEFRDDRVHA